MQFMAHALGDVDGGIATAFGEPGQRLARTVSGDHRVVGAVKKMQRRVFGCRSRWRGETAGKSQHTPGQAIVSLALAAQHDGLAGRVLAFAGCFTAPPAAAPEHTTLHLFHGADDAVIPADGSRQALAWLAERGGDATLDVAQGVGHELHTALVQCALQRLQNHIPARTWRAALGAAPVIRPALQVAGHEAAAPLPPP